MQAVPNRHEHREHRLDRPLVAKTATAGHIARAADSVEWFVEGAFGEGWNMDVEALIAATRAVETLEEATGWLDRAFGRAIETFESASDEDLAARIPDQRIMPGGVSPGLPRNPSSSPAEGPAATSSDPGQANGQEGLGRGLLAGLGAACGDASHFLRSLPHP